MLYSYYMSLNHSLFFTLFNTASHSPFVGHVAVFCAEYMQYVIALILVIYICYQKQDMLKRVWQVLVAAAAGIFARFVVKGIIIHFAPHPRPFVKFENVIPLVSKDVIEKMHSFPSGHTIFAFAIAVVIFSYNKKVGGLLLALSFLMGIGRIMVGVHFPIDILFGIILGILVGIVAVSVARLLTQKISFFHKFV